MAFPTIAAADSNFGSHTTNATSVTLGYPANCAVGDLILCFMARDGAGINGTWPAGWVLSTLAVASGSAANLIVAKKKSDGTETGTFNVTGLTSEQGCYRMIRIPAATWEGTLGTTFGNSNASDGSVVYGANGNSTSTSPAGSALDPFNWAAEDTLWIALAANDSTPTYTGFPTNYTQEDHTTAGGHGASSGGSNGAGLGVAYRQQNTASQGAGVATFTMSASEDWTFRIVAVRPSGSVQTTKTQTGKARIQKTVDRTVTGKSRVQLSAVRDILGKANVSIQASRTITGLANIIKTTAQDVMGKARVAKTVVADLLGKARIQRTSDASLGELIAPNGAVTTSTAGSGSHFLSFAHTVTAGNDQVLFVAAHAQQLKSYDLITFNGIPLTRLTPQFYYYGLFYLVNPPVGTFNVEITTSFSGAPTGRSSAAFCFKNVGLLPPYLGGENASNSTAPSVITVNDVPTNKIGLCIYRCADITNTGTGELDGTEIVDMSPDNRWQLLVSYQYGAGLGAPTTFTATGTGNFIGSFFVVHSFEPTQIQGRAKIAAPPALQTVTGTSRVQVTAAPKTITGLARIARTVSSTILGKANIITLTSVTKTILGKARVQLSTLQTVLGKARVSKQVLSTQTGKSRIQATAAPKTILGKSRVQIAISRTITGVAKILVTVSTTKTLQGKGRIQAAVSRTITGVASILVTGAASRTILGKARVQVAGVLKLQTGKARIQKTGTTSLTGRARVMKTVAANIPGVARIRNTFSVFITGQGRVATATVRTIQGRARITDPDLEIEGTAGDLEVREQAANRVEVVLAAANRVITVENYANRAIVEVEPVNTINTSETSANRVTVEADTV
jgi:hypothetical protein